MKEKGVPPPCSPWYSEFLRGKYSSVPQYILNLVAAENFNFLDKVGR